jgi:DNA invertase Pin-like site-specific DNA recombinase
VVVPQLVNNTFWFSIKRFQSMSVQVVGYARVSTKEQDLSLQLDALTKHGCDRVFTDKLSAAKQRQGLADALDYLRAGDTLVVWKLDRLCRSLPDLIGISEQIQQKGAALVSITESIDTSTPAGRLYFNILGALGQMERELIQERVKAGLSAARKRGKIGGKPRVSQDKLELARRELSEGRTYPDVARIIGVHPQTLYRLIPVRSLNL